MLDTSEILYPPFYPLTYLANHCPWELSERDDPDEIFEIEVLKGGRVTLRALDKIITNQAWELERLETTDGTSRYGVHSISSRMGSFVGISPSSIIYDGWRIIQPQRKWSTSFRRSLEVQHPDCSEILRKATWEYTLTERRASQDRNANILLLWRNLVRKNQVVLFFIEHHRRRGPIERFLMRQPIAALKKLSALVPSLSEFLCEDWGVIDLEGIKERLCQELPPDVHKYLDSPEDAEDFSRIRERLKVTICLRDDEVGDSVVDSVELLVQTFDDPTHRQKHGFGFIRDLLGVVPPVARKNTSGQEVGEQLDLKLLALGKKRPYLAQEIEDAVQSLLTYQDCFSCLEGKLDTIFDEFLETGWQRASLFYTD